MELFQIKNFIQVAGIIDKKEADLLIGIGVKYLGFPLRLPINKEDLTEKYAAKIIKNIKPPAYGVIISYCSTANEALELCRKLGAGIIQLHGSIDIKELERIKSVNQTIKIIKSLIIKDNDIDKLLNYINITENFIDAFITDSFDPKTGATGATGKIHDWKISRKIVRHSHKPVILAGGLNVNNVYEAILNVKPAGVDVHTGVEDFGGRKDKNLVQTFIREANRAFNFLENIKYY